MKNLRNVLMAFAILSVSWQAFAGSSMKVVNHSSVPVEAIWQASGCFGVLEDWNGDAQFTICFDDIIEPGEDSTMDFGLLHGDRSVKVLIKSGERVAYCNSMDDSTVTIEDSPDGVTSDNDCP